MTRPAASLSIVCAGALLAFAVTARVPGISLHAAGVIVILAGIAVAVLPPSPAADWLRRRLDTAGPEAGAGAEAGAAGDDADEYAAYLLQDPAVLAAEVLNGIRADRAPAPHPEARAEPRAAGRPAGPRPLRSVRLDRADLEDELG
jgi:hypothetical protein